ncbi:MAG TPA: hypothetical protein VIZ31_01750 [Vicinamibacteria bacterium]
MSGAEPDRFSALLVDVQRRLESLYALPAEAPVTEFVLGPQEAASLPGGGSRTLLRQEGDAVALGVVFEEEVPHRLRSQDPRVSLTHGNLGPLCTLTEEVSHFLYLLFCARSSRTVTELELELQGEVDKYLTAAFFLSLQNEGAVSTGLRRLLFREYHLAEGLSEEQAERYRKASRLAFDYCGYLEAEYLRPQRLPDLLRESRRFYRLGQRDKLERIARLH